jgi:oligopeptide transport system permease protein
MTATTQNSKVAKISPAAKGESLWAEAWKRLRRNRASTVGVIIIVLLVLMALFADVLAPYPFDQQNREASYAAPSWMFSVFPSMIPKGEPGGYVNMTEVNALGTDNLGRDLLSRIIYGARVSLIVAFVGPLTSILLGMLVGLIAGYFGGWVDNLLMRLVDIMYAFPTLLFIILLMTFFDSSFADPIPGSLADTIGKLDKATGGMMLIFIGIGLTSWMQMARLVRGQVLSLREKEFILAANALGVPNRRIILAHILPNILGPLIVAETLSIPTYSSYEAFLSFIGLGVNPPTPSWGGMIADGAANITGYPYLAMFPSLALCAIVLAFNFLGDGLRDALDPRMRGVE